MPCGAYGPQSQRWDRTGFAIVSQEIDRSNLAELVSPEKTLRITSTLGVNRTRCARVHVDCHLTSVFQFRVQSCQAMKSNAAFAPDSMLLIKRSISSAVCRGSVGIMTVRLRIAKESEHIALE